MGRTSSALLALSLCLCFCSTSWAQDTKAGLREVYGAAEGAYGRISEDGFVGLTLKGQLKWGIPLPGFDELGTLRVAAIVPLRLRVQDEPPLQGTGLRQRDWDAPTDALRVLRYAGVVSHDRTFEVAVGDIGPLDLGHGTLVFHHYNNTALDVYHMGALFKVLTDTWSVHGMISDVFDPGVMAARVSRAALVPELVVGASVVADRSAPETLKLDDDPGAYLAADDTGRPIPDQTSTQLWLGADMQWSFIKSGASSLTQYVDVNWHTDVGAGVHVGVDFGFESQPLVMTQKLEVNFSAGGYLPRYIGPLYDVDRVWFAQWGQRRPAPKLAFARTQEQTFRAGFMAQNRTIWAGLLDMELVYAQRADEPQTALMLGRVGLHLRDVLHVGGFVARHGATNIFTKRDALISSEAVLNVTDFLYVTGQYGVRWELNEVGGYEPASYSWLGLGARLVLR